MKEGHCPVCKVFRKIPHWNWNKLTGEVFDTWLPQSMYQYSYKSNKDYISPRCDICMQKVRKKKDRQEA